MTSHLILHLSRIALRSLCQPARGKFPFSPLLASLWYWSSLAKAFKPYASQPRFDLDEFKDSFELWHAQRKTFLALSTIDTVLEVYGRQENKTNIPLSCLSKETLQAVLTVGLDEDDLKNHKVIIQQLRDRCNVGRNRHVWRQSLL
jgi:hypothetical protein